MTFGHQVQHIFFLQPEILFSFFFKNRGYGSAFLLFNFFIKVKKRNVQLLGKELPPMCFAASHKTDEKYFHMLMRECADGQICRCANMQMCRCADLQIMILMNE